MPLFQGTTKLRVSGDLNFDLGDGSTQQGILRAQMLVEAAAVLKKADQVLVTGSQISYDCIHPHTYIHPHLYPSTHLYTK